MSPVAKSTKIFALVVLLVAGQVTVEPLYAQAECGVERDVSTQALDEAVWKQLNSIYEDVGEENYDEAYQDLQKLVGRAGRDKYLQAILSQALAQVEWARENFDSALQHFERAVALNTLPNQAHFALMYQIAQLYAMKERYDEALERLDLWFCMSPAEEITSAAYVLEASIYAEKKDFAAALKAIEQAIAMDDEPRESWYQLKLASHYELEQFPQVAETLETMIVHWPDKKVYWTQLSQIYFKLKQDDKALAVQALAYRRGMLDKQSDLIYLSSLYSNAEVPYKAADVLQQGIEDGIVEPSERHWTLVADNWYAADELEKALAAFEKAGRAADDGGIDLRRGYILTDLERWQDAREAMNQALEKGGISERKTGEAYLLRGMAGFNLGDIESATADWTRARRYDSTREAAQQWINHMREEQRRRAS
ncbi:MAG: tetratricopeptide repeat protein [Xanthomonadales bacterium]|nr:tetratricopeptide repeat protein [Xanthomonadales bacterium]